MRSNKTQEEVINEFRRVHGDFYNYDKVVYIGTNKKVIITCPIHGDFPQAPARHKRGNNCPDCVNIRTSNKIIEKTKSNLIEDFKKVHGNRYNYDKVVYEDSKKNVIIVCPIHGDFPQTPVTHKRGAGCPDCANIKKANKIIEKAKNNLIEDFVKVHGNKYDYDKVVYSRDSEKVIITCPLHGDFPQTPSSHKQGSGCSGCGREDTSKYQQLNPAGWSHTNWQKAGENSINFDSFKVYIIRCWNEEEEFYKIGKTYKTVEKRFDNKNKMPYNYETVLEEVFENAKEASIREVALKVKNRENKYIPKNKFGGMYECFSINPCTIKNSNIHIVKVKIKS